MQEIILHKKRFSEKGTHIGSDVVQVMLSKFGQDILTAFLILPDTYSFLRPLILDNWKVTGNNIFSLVPESSSYFYGNIRKT